MSSNEWYTPTEYVEAVRKVMGNIDLDPASCIIANLSVKATNFYSIEDNGLEKEWYGNVYLNPPYSSLSSPCGIKGGKRKGATGLWIDRVISLYKSNTINQAIVCINADVERKWFKDLWEYTFCFVHKPIRFIRPSGKREHHFFGSCFVYLGIQETKFIEVFRQFGTIARRVV